jgi:RNA polymerase sigma-70 factor, ECF subfamily
MWQPTYGLVTRSLRPDGTHFESRSDRRGAGHFGDTSLEFAGYSDPRTCVKAIRCRTPGTATLSRLGIDEANAQEIVQETFLKLHLHLLGKGNRKNLKAWLYRVAHNLARNQQSSSWVRLTTSIDAPRAGEAPERSSSATPESLLLDRERDLRFRRALDNLSDAQRACLALRAEGFKYREIADVLELSTSTVGENVQRGLEKLKELL